MLKGMSKATSLLVAAAAIISTIPANAADYKKTDTQEGTVYNAVAYKDGKFYIDGDINDKGDGAYYLANGKLNNLSDLDSGEATEVYGSKYLNVQSGDYFIDLSSGSVTNTSIKENAEDDAATALRKNVKKDTDGRYATSDAGTIKSLAGAELTGSKFSDVWYGVQYAANKATNGNASKLNVYTDGNGNYIDADYNIGSVKVTTKNGSTEKVATVSNTNDNYDGAGATKAISASVATSSTVIGQDSSYIYRKATITITSSNASAPITKINGVAIADKTSVFTISGNATSVSFDVIQKISKAQASDKINGAKYAKSVTNYIISKDNGDALSTALLSNYSISNGKLINYTVSGSSIKTQTITLTSKNSYYYTDLGDQSSESAQATSGTAAVDTDSNGNLWRLSAGYIYKWNNDEDWTKVYKVDGSFDKMSVYDDNNIVAWNESDEVYSVIGGQITSSTSTSTTDTSTTGTTTTGTTTTTPVVNKGWISTPLGWTFYNATGTQVKGQWLQDGSTWYYIKADGIMATGWIKDGANWYYLSGSGAMQTGWINDNGTWYYLNSSGAMLSNTTINGYKLGPSGAWIK